MRPDDGLGDEEPQAEAVAAPDLLPARFERMEDAGQHVGGNLPLVVHLGDNQFLAGVDLHLDRRARRTVLDGVAHQVRDRLRQPVRVPLADRLALTAKLEGVLFRDAVELVEDLAADRAQIGASGGEGNAGALPLAGEVQQIAHDVRDPLRSAQHALGGALHDGGFGRLQERRRGARDGVQRIADVVADDGDDPLLEIAGRGELLLTSAVAGFLGPAPVVDVHAASDEAREVARLVVEGSAAIEDPPVFAVVAAEPVFHLERLATMEMIQVVFHAAFDVFRMDALRPAVSDLLGERTAGELEPGIVEVVALRVERRAPDHDGRVLDEEPVFGRAQWTGHDVSLDVVSRVNHMRRGAPTLAGGDEQGHFSTASASTATSPLLSVDHSRTGPPAGSGSPSRSNGEMSNVGRSALKVKAEGLASGRRRRSRSRSSVAMSGPCTTRPGYPSCSVAYR